MRIPLEKRLKKRLQVETGLLQDEVMELVYSIDSSTVLHGGTAVWRCYGGNRFSEDLDLYCRNAERMEQGLRDGVGRLDISITKLKRTSNLIFCKVARETVEVRLEANFSARPKPVVGAYEKINGTFMSVLTLAPEELMLEKARAFASRKFIRDIYDVHHLSALAGDREQLRREMRKLLSSLPPPVDEKNLKAIVFSGAIPSFSQLAEQLRRRFG